MWAGFSLRDRVAAYLVLVVVPGVALWIWGNATIMVADGELRAGRAALPLARAGQVQALDAAGRPPSCAARWPTRRRSC